MQNNFNIEAGKISAPSSGKFNKYKYVTGEEILPLKQSGIMKNATLYNINMFYSAQENVLLMNS